MNIEKAKRIGYWGATGLVAAEFLMGGVMSLARPPVAVAGMEHLGYPSYFGLILGAWKVLGVLALLAPGLPRLKEWAYAGIVFDLTGAAFSHAAVGDGSGDVLAPLVLLALAVASWAWRPATRALRRVAAQDQAHRPGEAAYDPHWKLASGRVVLPR